MIDLANPVLIPIIVAPVSCLMVVFIVMLVNKQKRHQAELDAEMRVKEMEHVRKMKEMELEMARIKAGASENSEG